MGRVLPPAPQWDNKERGSCRYFLHSNFKKSTLWFGKLDKMSLLSSPTHPSAPRAQRPCQPPRRRDQLWGRAVPAANRERGGGMKGGRAPLPVPSLRGETLFCSGNGTRSCPLPGPAFQKEPELKSFFLPGYCTSLAAPDSFEKGPN